MTMPAPNDDDPFAQPPDWVPLSDLARWLEWHFKLPESASELIPEINHGIRGFELAYRVDGFQSGAASLPSGFGWSDDLKRIVVTDWDLVQPNWKQGTVAGPPRWNDHGDRYTISVWWPRAARWAEPFASDMRRRRAKKTAPDHSPPAVPERVSKSKPTKASDARVLNVMREVYARYKIDRRKPPNKAELPKEVNDILAAVGESATWEVIQKLAQADEFADQRLDPGEHFKP